MVTLKPGQCLYDAFGVSKDADLATIRQKYKKLAVLCHPDRNPDDPTAHERFQTLQKVYGILSDPEKRKIYDRTGSVEDTENFSGEQFDNLYAFYRAMFVPVTTDTIDDFATTFKGGAEERSHILKYYTEFKGKMAQVFNHVMLSDPQEDAHRFMDIIDAAIDGGEVRRYAVYTKWAKSVAQKPRPSAAAADDDGAGSTGEGKTTGAKGKTTTTTKKKKQVEGSGDASARDTRHSDQALVEALQKRRRGAFEGMLSSLSEKYGGTEGALEVEPTDEEFEAARKRIESQKKGKH